MSFLQPERNVHLKLVKYFHGGAITFHCEVRSQSFPLFTLGKLNVYRHGFILENNFFYKDTKNAKNITSYLTI